ncbi:MAG: thiamine diphosphokinase [Prevotellaceae bacterium]|jgi:thiamine pyrophosphokinase|nr:thiamine diphosphokinase [Prevotellaceae bacterium]
MFEYLDSDYSVVLCNGKFPEHDIPLKLLDNARKIICCDGAALKLLQYGKEPYSIVGDLDSLPDCLIAKYNDRIFKDEDQETNDQTKAVLWCRDRNINPIIILGATGLREDHTIANIALLTDYIDFVDIVMVTDTGIFIPLNKSKTFKAHKNQQISIFAITPDTKITTAGLKYEVSQRCFNNWNQGSLNEVLSDSFQIIIDKGKVIVYLTSEVNN